MHGGNCATPRGAAGVMGAASLFLALPAGTRKGGGGCRLEEDPWWTCLGPSRSAGHVAIEGR